MKYKLIKPVNPKYSALQQVLTNRGVAYEDIYHYLNTTDNDINSPELLGENLLNIAVHSLIETIQANEKCVIIVDCDCDGYTSAAILINYLYELFPNWVTNKLSWIMHTGKQHGLNDCLEQIIQQHPALVILPDAGSNDFNEHQLLKDNKIKIIVLDHHDAEIPENYINDNCVIINNNAQYSEKQ